VSTRAASTALDRARELLDPDRLAAEPQTHDGILDVLDGEAGVPRSAAQQLMESSLLPQIYEFAWRPLGLALASGRSRADELETAHRHLALTPGETLIDVACGPGNITRGLVGALGEHGLAIGIDASATMLARAVRDTRSTQVAYLRGNAQALPFHAACADAVCCYAALYLFDDPLAALAEMARVLRPGGRIAILTSCARGPSPLRALARLATAPSGVRVFGRDEVTGALRELGLVEIDQDVARLAQYVGARKDG
jgi:SAM-dependent methyltransferase